MKQVTEKFSITLKDQDYEDAVKAKQDAAAAMQKSLTQPQDQSGSKTPPPKGEKQPPAVTKKPGAAQLEIFVGEHDGAESAI
jgi:hypothetical protein